MYKKLPKILFQHNFTLFNPVKGYSNNGLIIFTSEKAAKFYTKSEASVKQNECYKPISQEQLVDLLKVNKNNICPDDYLYSVIFNPITKSGKFKYDSIYTCKELLSLIENSQTFCSGHSEDYHPEHFQGLMDQFDFQGELTDILDGYTKSDFDQQMINEIVLWKVNRYVTTKSENHWLALLNTFKDDKELDPAKLRHFLEMVLPNKTRGIRLAMASTFLRFRNPEIYQIIDERTFRVVLKGEGEQPKLASYTKVEDQIDLYIRYLKNLRELCDVKKINFEDSDRILYQFDIIKNGDFK